MTMSLKALAEDIKAKGLTEPITLYEGKVLDGRNRYRACDLAEVELRQDHFTQYEGDDALGFVVSKNLRRRHLNESQRAAIAAEIANMPEGLSQRSTFCKFAEGHIGSRSGRTDECQPALGRDRQNDKRL